MLWFNVLNNYHLVCLWPVGGVFWRWNTHSHVKSLVNSTKFILLKTQSAVHEGLAQWQLLAGLLRAHGSEVLCTAASIKKSDEAWDIRRVPVTSMCKYCSQLLTHQCFILLQCNCCRILWRQTTFSFSFFLLINPNAVFQCWVRLTACSIYVQFCTSQCFL